jgi:hypothetical protein
VKHHVWCWHYSSGQHHRLETHKQRAPKPRYQPGHGYSGSVDQAVEVEQHGTYHKWQIRALELRISVEREFSVLSFRKTFQACAWCACQCWALVVMDRMVIFFLVPAILTIKQDIKRAQISSWRWNSNIVDTTEKRICSVHGRSRIRLSASLGCSDVTTQ